MMMMMMDDVTDDDCDDDSNDNKSGDVTDILSDGEQFCTSLGQKHFQNCIFAVSFLSNLDILTNKSFPFLQCRWPLSKLA